MIKKNRVVIGIPVLLLGGTEIQVLSLVRVLVEVGYQATVCCYYEYEEAVASIFMKNGAQVILMGLKRKDGLWDLSKKLRTLLKQISPDIVHIQYLAPGLVPIIAARLAGQKTIFATVHIAGSFAYGSKAKILLRIASTLCTAFFCVSKGVEEFWFGNSEVLDPKNINPSRKHFTIYNAIDTEKISEIVRWGGSEIGRERDGELVRWGDRESEKNIEREEVKKKLSIESKNVIGIVGRLAVQKGHTVLLDAMVEVIKQIPDVILVVIGDGPERNSLEQRAKSLGIEKNVKWLGVREQEEVFKLYSIMDVFAMPSLYEGFGLTAAEAMAAGLPVVGTQIEGLSEVIENGATGYLLPAGDANALAKALVDLLSDPKKSKEMGDQGRKRVNQLFSIERFKESMLAAYEYFIKESEIGR